MRGAMSWVRVLAIVAALAGCGGGGGGGPAGVAASGSLSFSPASIEKSYPANGQSISPPQVSLVATASNIVASGTVYAFVIADAAVIQTTAQVTPTQNPNVYNVTLFPSSTLAAGTYRGTLTVKLCQDAACNQLLAQTPLPYTFTVQPAIVLSANVNGVPVAGNTINVKDGDVITVNSSMAVGWDIATGGVIFSGGTYTPTTFTSTLRYGISTPGATGSASVRATIVSSQQAASITILLTQ